MHTTDETLSIEATNFASRMRNRLTNLQPFRVIQ
jgi:hypothetical protein